MIEKLEAIEICFGLFLLYSGIEGRYYLKSQMDYLKLQICTEVFPYLGVNRVSMEGNKVSCGRGVVLTKYVCL